MPAIRKSDSKPHSAAGAYERTRVAVGSKYTTVVEMTSGATNAPSPQSRTMPVFGRLAGRIVIADDFDTWPDEVLDAIEGVRP